MILVGEQGLTREDGSILVPADRFSKVTTEYGEFHCVSFSNRRKDFVLNTICHPQLRYYSPANSRKGTLIDQLAEHVGPFRVCRFLTFPEDYHEAVDQCSQIVDESGYNKVLGNVLINPQVLASKFSHPEFQIVSDNSGEIYYVISCRMFGTILPKGGPVNSISVSSNHYIWSTVQLICRHIITFGAEMTHVLICPWGDNVLVDEEALWEKEDQL